MTDGGAAGSPAVGLLGFAAAAAAPGAVVNGEGFSAGRPYELRIAFPAPEAS